MDPLGFCLTGHAHHTWTNGVVPDWACAMFMDTSPTGVGFHVCQGNGELCEAGAVESQVLFWRQSLWFLGRKRLSINRQCQWFAIIIIISNQCLHFGWLSPNVWFPYESDPFGMVWGPTMDNPRVTVPMCELLRSCTIWQRLVHLYVLCVQLMYDKICMQIWVQSVCF